MTNQNSNGNNNNNNRDWNSTNPQSTFGQVNNGNQGNQGNSNSNASRINNDGAIDRRYLGTLKEEIANELGINLNDPNITAHNAGKVGGNMVKRMINQVKQDQQSQQNSLNKR